jgi:hypothetical protein
MNRLRKRFHERLFYPLGMFCADEGLTGRVNNLVGPFGGLTGSKFI